MFFFSGFLIPVNSVHANDSDQLYLEVQKKQITHYYEAIGTIRPKENPTISSRVQAEVLEVLVNPGDEVEPGQLMIRLDDREFKSRQKQAVEQYQAARAAVRQTEQETARARAVLDEASLEYDRHKDLYARNVVSRQELDRTASTYYQALAAHKSTLMAGRNALHSEAAVREKVKEQNVLLQYTEIRAANSGQVVQRFTHPGDMASPGKALLEMQSRNLPRLETTIPERLISRIALDQQHIVRVDSMKTKFQGRVVEIAPQADRAVRSFLIKLDIEPGTHVLYSGMLARLLLPLEHEDVILIPENAVRFLGQLETVMVMEGDKTQFRHIRSGRQINNMIEILSGLNVGEKIVIEQEGSN